MNITEQDIKESVEYKGVEKNMRIFAVLATVFASSYTLLFLFIAIFQRDNGVTIYCFVGWLIIMSATQIPFWCSYGVRKRNLKRLLCNYQNMYYVEPVFGKVNEHYYHTGRFTRVTCDFTLTINHKGQLVDVRTRAFRRTHGGIFGFKYYEGHKVACLYDPETKRKQIYIIKRID